MNTLICVKCNIEFNHPRIVKFCGKICRFSGCSNPNFGKRWSLEQKNKQSSIIKNLVDDEYRLKVGSANRGKKFSKEKIDAMHAHRPTSSYSHPHSQSSKKKIGEKSKAKFTSEYKYKVAKKMQDLGKWIRPEDKSDLCIYNEKSSWVVPMWDLFESIPTGIFNSRTNSKGMVRDHIFSRLDGFTLKIWPELLRHPANCQLLTHADNIRKKSISGYTLNELYDKIKNYDKAWFEQDLCLSKIKLLEQGIFWERKEVSE